MDLRPQSAIVLARNRGSSGHAGLDVDRAALSIGALGESEESKS